MRELQIALRTKSHPSRHRSLDTVRQDHGFEQVMRTINHKVLLTYVLDLTSILNVVSKQNFSED